MTTVTSQTTSTPTGTRLPPVIYVLAVLACCAIVCGSSLAAYSFISPLLINRTGMPGSAVPLVLVAYGVGALIGSYLGGHLAAHRPYRVRTALPR